LKQQTCMPNNNNTNIEILVFCWNPMTT
jgi:hypothetical protein